MGVKEQLKNAVARLSEEGLSEEDLIAIRRSEEQIVLGESGSLDDLKRELNL